MEVKISCQNSAPSSGAAPPLVFKGVVCNPDPTHFLSNSANISSRFAGLVSPDEWQFHNRCVKISKYSLYPASQMSAELIWFTTAV